MNVTLSDGTVAAVPDGLSDDAIKNFTTRLEAANSNAKSASAASSQSQGASEPSLWDKVVAWGNQTPAQALGFAPPSGASSVNVPVSNAPPELLPETAPLFPRDQYPGVDAALDWMQVPTFFTRRRAISSATSAQTLPRCPGTRLPASPTRSCTPPRITVTRRTSRAFRWPRPGSRRTSA